MRRVARTQATIDASHVYEHLSKHRSKARTERTGSNKPRVPPRSSFHYSLDYDAKLHSPTQKHLRRALGTAGAGGVRGDAPSPNALVTRPAPSTPPNLVKAELRAIRARPHTSDDARMASTHCASPATSDKISRPRSITGPAPATASYRRRRRRRRRRRTASAPTATQHAF